MKLHILSDLHLDHRKGRFELEEVEHDVLVCIGDWSCPVFVPLPVLVYATFRSKAIGLFQPNAECLRRGL